jgi:hypothetical protein
VVSRSQSSARAFFHLLKPGRLALLFPPTRTHLYETCYDLRLLYWNFDIVV